MPNSDDAVPFQVILKREHFISQILSKKDIEENWDHGIDISEVQCFPLVSLLLAANLTSVDYFSLDVEGQEFNVLKSIPFDRMNIKVINVYVELYLHHFDCPLVDHLCIV